MRAMGLASVSLVMTVFIALLACGWAPPQRPDPRSALAHFADSNRTSPDVREAPICDIRRIRRWPICSGPSRTMRFGLRALAL